MPNKEWVKNLRNTQETNHLHHNNKFLRSTPRCSREAFGEDFTEPYEGFELKEAIRLAVKWVLAVWLLFWSLQVAGLTNV